MTNKLTNRKALAIAINHLSVDGDSSLILEGVSYPLTDVLSKLKAMAVTLDNKATSTNRKPTKTQLENAGLRDAIMAFLRENPNLIVTCTDLVKHMPELQSNQKVSALLRPLVDSKEVVKLTEKGKTYFQLAKPDVELEDNGDEG